MSGSGRYRRQAVLSPRRAAAIMPDMKAFLCLAALLVSLAAPSGAGALAQAKEPEAQRCPATLPAPVAARHRAILAAARAGDYQALRRQVTDLENFEAVIGDGGDPLPIWQEAQRRGQSIARAMAAIFAMPCSVVRVDGKTLYSWPSASDFPWPALTPPERAALQAFYGAKIDENWLEGREKGYYVGWRGHIDGDGTWLAFIIGD
jgi:hypothetical protein